MKANKEIHLWAVLFWLAVWQCISVQLNNDILLVSPVKVIIRLGQLMMTSLFWKSVLFTLVHIATGFLAAVGTGCILAVAASHFQGIHALLAPIMLTIKSVPVASFIILALIWFSSKNLSVLISFLMVLPIIYTNMLSGIKSVDRQLLEMAQVFSIPKLRVARYIYLQQLLPFFYSACTVSLGLSWKAGVAAEVIGIPKGSVGERLQQAKIYLNTPDLFAWTLVIVLLSLLFEKITLYIIAQITARVTTLKERRFQTIDWIPVKTNDIYIRTLTKSFGNKVVLKNLNMKLQGGKINCIMAQSGAGKTTLLRIMMGLERADSGTIEGIDGKKQSVVFQEERLCENMTSIENICFVNSKLTINKVRGELEKVGLIDCVNQPVSELSGGMRRRVSILRALLAEYDVLFLDEPFQGLDSERKEQVIQYVKEKTAGKTIVFVTHDIWEAKRLEAIVTVWEK